MGQVGKEMSTCARLLKCRLSYMHSKPYCCEMKYFKKPLLLLVVMLFALLGLMAGLGIMTLVGFTYNVWFDGASLLLIVSAFAFAGYTLSRKIVK